jgi:predicted outer membrane repeat protein
LVGCGALVVALLAAVTTGTATAGGVPNAPIEVTTVDDVVNPGDGLVSLREAFATASADAGDDTIELTTEPGGGRFEAASCQEGVGDFDHTDETGALTIEGNGNAVAVTCGNRAIDSASTGLLTLRDLTVEDSGYERPGPNNGGGVRAVGDVLGERLVVRTSHMDGGGKGGGLASEGDVELRDSVIAHNTAGKGGGVWARNIRLVDTIIRRNASFDGGGVRAAQAVTATGSTFTTNTSYGLPGAAVRCCGDGGAILSDGGEVRVIDSTFVNNHATGTGGAIRGGDAIVRDTTLRGNGADEAGGAIYTSGPARIVRSTIRLGRGGDTGGGLRADSAEVLSSTVSGNQAQVGGGIWVQHDVSLADSTVSANRAYTGAPGDSRGGGVFAAQGSVSVLRSTVVANQAEYGANVRAGDSFTARTTVIGRAVGGTSCWGPAAWVSHGYNVTDPSGPCGLTGASDRSVARLNLGPLADNGGPTLTHLPLDASLGIIALAACPTVPDQRGQPRPQGPRCEAGSVEIP